MAKEWLQIKGDPSTGQFLFEQERTTNEFDKSFDTVLNRECALLHHRGVFHAKEYFSSGQVALRLNFSCDRSRYRYYINCLCGSAGGFLGKNATELTVVSKFVPFSTI